ncbi:MAG: ABC transporter substrate-binding protein [Deltaproteobacteria bacterium]|nr:ABC transporter substrate-binding protein [Deltaproteobacteria bacterium]
MAVLAAAACQPPDTRCRNDGDCDTTVRYCAANGTCQPLAGRPGGSIPARCTVYGAQPGSSSAAGAALVVGALLPRTRADGAEDPRGRLREQAARLVVEELNPPQRQGVAGRSLALVSCDTAGDATTAAALAGDLVELGALAIISAGSAETLAASAVTIPAGVLLISSSATTPELTDLPDLPAGGGAGLVWRTAASDAFQGAVLSSLLTDGNLCGLGGTGAASAAVIYLDDPYGQGLYTVFSRHFTRTEAGFLYARAGSIDTALAAAAAANPAALVVIGFPDDVTRILDATVGTSLGAVPLFLTDSARNPALFTLAHPERLAGACGTAPAPADTTSAAYDWFGQQYQQKFGEDPLSASFVPNTYDAMMLIALAAAWALQPGRTLNGAALAEGLRHLSAVDGGTAVNLDVPSFNTAVSRLAAGGDLDVQGTSGPLDFDNATGEAPAAVQVWEAADGGFTTLRVVQP